MQEACFVLAQRQNLPAKSRVGLQFLPSEFCDRLGPGVEGFPKPNGYLSSLMMQSNMELARRLHLLNRSAVRLRDD
jgi:hypothetical protein